MRRRRPRIPRMPRTPKVRAPKTPKSAFTVKVKPAYRAGKCVGCHGAFQQGDPVAYVTAKTRKYHQSCCPADPAAALAAAPAAAVAPPTPPTAHEAKLLALADLEAAVKAQAAESGVSDELEKAWDRYTKIKRLALRAGSSGEEQAAFRMALLDAVKMVF